MACPIHATTFLLRRTVLDPASGHGLPLPSLCLIQSSCRATAPDSIPHEPQDPFLPSLHAATWDLCWVKRGLPASMGYALLPAITSPWHPWSLASKLLMSPLEPHTAQHPRARGPTRNKTTSISSFLCSTNSELPQQDLKELS